jgi:hypothetical protein
VVYLKFSYDLYNSNTETAVLDQADGGAGLSPALTPYQISKINIKHMAIDSTLKGAKGGYQGLDLDIGQRTGSDVQQRLSTAIAAETVTKSKRDEEQGKAEQSDGDSHHGEL